MSDSTSWRKVVFEDALVVTVLIAIGAVFLAIKLTPIVLRWVTKS